MKLQSFNPDTLPGYIRTGRATLGVNFKTGLFNFSKSAVELLNIGAGSCIELHQDEENPADWYIQVATAGNGFALRESKDKDLLFLNHTGLAKLIKDCFEHEDVDPRSASFGISAEPIEHEDSKLYGIIITTASFKY